MRGNERNAYRLYPISKPTKEIRCFLQDVVCIISAICTSVWYLVPGMSKAPVPGTVLVPHTLAYLVPLVYLVNRNEGEQ